MKDPALLQIPEEHILAAFAAMMLGSSPLDPPPDATAIAVMASKLAAPRPARRPGDVEGTRAYRSVYSLAREQGAPLRKSGYRADRASATRAWIVLESTLDLRHRQRAGIALRYVFGLPSAGVARVLGLSSKRTAELLRSATANVAKRAGGRVDVARHLRSVGAMVRARDVPPEARRPAGQARSVVKLLLSSPAETASPDSAIAASIARIPRPVYRVRESTAPVPRLAALVPAPIAAEKRPRRARLLVAACVAALAFLGAFAPTAILQPSGRVPLATVPIAPGVQDAVARSVDVPQASPAYRVQIGDTLWSIAGTLLGDAHRWRDVWRTNAGRVMLDGSRFVDPNLIQPGWRLRLPGG